MKIIILSSPRKTSSTAGFRLRMMNGIISNPLLAHCQISDLPVSFSSCLYILFGSCNLLFLHKVASPFALLALVLCRIRRIPAVFDVCDSLIFSLDSFTISISSFFYLLRLISFSIAINLSTYISVSSESLRFSFSSRRPVYLPDIYDVPPLTAPMHKHVSLALGSKSELPIRHTILWYGSSGSSSSFQGIDELLYHRDELYKCLDRIHNLVIVSNLDLNSRRKISAELISLSASITYLDWSPDFWTELPPISCVYLPCLESIKTFYKSENRVAYASACGIPVICGFRQSYRLYSQANPNGIFCGSLMNGLNWLEHLTEHDLNHAREQAILLNSLAIESWASFLVAIMAQGVQGSSLAQL